MLAFNDRRTMCRVCSCMRYNRYRYQTRCGTHINHDHFIGVNKGDASGVLRPSKRWCFEVECIIALHAYERTKTNVSDSDIIVLQTKHEMHKTYSTRSRRRIHCYNFKYVL